MKDWVLSLTGASVFCALAMTLCPKGRVRAVTGFVCAMVCMLAMLSPLLHTDMEKLSASMAYWNQQAQSLVETEEEAGRLQQRTIIQEQCESYILDEAQRLQIDLSGAEVQAVWDEDQKVWYPRSVCLDGAYNEALSAAIEAELGIAKEEQGWRG